MTDLISRQAAIEYLMTNMCWYNEDGYEETEDEKRNAITDLINGVPSAQSQPEEDCDTCKHGYFGDRWCDNCRVRYPSHYEREEE